MAEGHLLKGQEDRARFPGFRPRVWRGMDLFNDKRSMNVLLHNKPNLNGLQMGNG